MSESNIGKHEESHFGVYLTATGIDEFSAFKTSDYPEKFIVLALIDILGFSRMIHQNSLTEIAQIYHEFLEVCNKAKVTVVEPGAAIKEIHSDKTKILSIDTKGNETSSIWEGGWIKSALFSDTMLLWFEGDENGKFDSIVFSVFGDLVNSLVCHAFSKRIPLRGGLSCGKAIMIPERGIYLGQPIVDAHLAEGAQRIIGVGISNSIVGLIPFFQHGLIPFYDHIKQDRKHDIAPIVFNWTERWRISPPKGSERDVIPMLIKRGTDERFASYYLNTIKLAALSDSIATENTYPAIPCTELDFTDPIHFHESLDKWFSRYYTLDMLIERLSHYPEIQIQRE